MNLIKDFIDCGADCPVCGDKLTLFMAVENCVCFKAVEEFPVNLHDFFHFSNSNPTIASIEFRFMPAFHKKGGGLPYNSSEANYQIDDNEIVLVNVKEDSNDVKYNSDNCYKVINNKNVYFFYICNKSAIRDLGNDFRINTHNACYYRSTPKMNLTDSVFTLLDDTKDTSINHETVSIHKYCESFEKTYILSMDYNVKKTKFYYYKITDEDKKHSENKVKAVRPKILEKEFDLLIKRPDFGLDARDKLINKFESWVLLS